MAGTPNEEEISMRLIGLKVSNFRCFKEETAVDLDNITVLIGKNDSGKSSLFDAIDIFIDEKRGPEGDDCCVHTRDSTVRITCVFDSFPKELVIDEQHPTDLTNENLLNSDGNLEIAKVYSCSGTGKGKLVGVFARAKHPTVENYGDLLTLTNAKLKQRANQLSVDLSGVNQTINTELRRAIWAHAGDLKFEETDVELKSEAAGKIWEQLKKYLPVFALFKSDRPSTDQDSEAQDPMKAAVREALKAQERTLNEIAEHVKKEVQEIANRTVEKIKEMNPELASQLTPRVSNKSWDSLFSVSLTGDEDIPINKRGSGTRRLILLNFFRAKAEKEAESKDTGVIYAIEEPETSQHPNNQKMLIDAFEDLAGRAACQVFLTTHTPMLARRFARTSLRYVTQKDGKPVIYDGRADETLLEIVDSLGVLPDHNIKVFFGVEGRNDIAFLTTISRILRDSGEDVPDLRKAEDDGHLVFVPLGGNSLDLWVSRLKGFNRPEFYLMDRDTRPPEKPKYHAIAHELSKRANCTVWTTGRMELENYIHPDIIKFEYPKYTGAGVEFEDVPALFAQAVHEASSSDKTWADIVSDSEKFGKKVSNAKRRLCSEFVSKMTPDLLKKIDANDEVRTWLKAIGVALNSG
jgi:predicted ATPase